jgi:hypothetical protein
MSDFFGGTRPGRTVTHGKATFELPILYYRDDLFALFYTADLEAVRRVMPSPRLHPVTAPGGRALVGVAAWNYIDTSIGPYGEVGVVVPAVHGSRPPFPILPAILEARYPGFGAVVLHLPVTTIKARDAGRGEWGFTKFVADMHFVIAPEYQECRLSEDGMHILTLRVTRSGLALRDEKPIISYTVNNGSLLRTVMPQTGLCRTSIRPSNSFLELGNHEVSRSIRELGLGDRPLLSRYYLERSCILPSGRVVEGNAWPLDGYFGRNRKGKLTVEYVEGSG